MTMTLYTSAVSPNCRRVEATLHALDMMDGVKIERVQFDSGFLQSEAFRALNPNAKVPTLVHEDAVLWESNAIMHYLVGLAGESTLAPSGNRERAEVLRWQFWESMHFNRAIGMVVWETVAKPMFGMGPADESIIERGLTDFQKYAAILDGHLAERAFVLGPQLTIADFSVACISALVNKADSRIPISDYRHVQRWYRALDDHPAWQATAPMFVAPLGND